MRKVFTTADAAVQGITPGQLRWGERSGRWRRAGRGVYLEGPEEVGTLDRARALVVATGGVATGALAGELHGLDGVSCRGADVTVAPTRSGRRRGVRRRDLLGGVSEVGDIRCADGLQTMVDLAVTLDDLGWEQALESALRKELLVLQDLVAVLPRLATGRSLSRARRPAAP